MRAIRTERCVCARNSETNVFIPSSEPAYSCNQGYKTLATHYNGVHCKLLEDPTVAKRWCRSAENYFGGYCRKGGFASPEECYAIDIPGTVAIQFRGGGCDFYRLDGAAPTDCPDGYHAGRGATTTDYMTVATHYDGVHCQLVDNVGFAYEHDGHCGSGYMRGSCSKVDSATACSKYCTNTSGCGFFSYSPNFLKGGNKVDYNCCRHLRRPWNQVMDVMSC